MSADDAEEPEAMLKGIVTAKAKGGNWTAEVPGPRVRSRSSPMSSELDVNVRVMIATGVGMTGKEGKW